MRRNLTSASIDAAEIAPASAPVTRARATVRLALATALTLLATLVLAAQASAFAEVTSFDGSRTPAGSMVPERLAVDLSSGDVYVIDGANNVVDRFDRYGKYLSQLTIPAASGGSFKFDNADDSIAVDNSSASTKGNVYVVGENNTGPGLVAAFKSDGTFLWQANPSFPAPSQISGVAVNPVNGDLWVADRYDGIQRISPANGSPLGDVPFGASATGGGAAHIAFNTLGDLYASYPGDVTVEYTTPLGASPPATIDTNATRDVAIDSTNNDVYVVRNFKIDVWSVAGVIDPNAPFVNNTPGTIPTWGVAVNGAADRIYVADHTSSVGIWAHNAPTLDALTVTVNQSGSGAGKVDADHGAILGCTTGGGVCTASYEPGDTVTLTATATTGVFDGWSGPDAGACAGTTAACAVTVSAAKSITATFSPPSHTVTVSKNGTGTGTVTVTGTSGGASGKSIVCGATCSGPFDDGTSASATAVADAGSTFTGWTVSGCSGTGACTVNVSAPTTITATFARNAPAASTGGASGVGQSAATLAGSVNPNGNATSCHFDYGTSTAYGSTAPCAPSPGSGTAAVSVSASLSGLAAGTLYHYRLVASNGAGQTANGADASFTTSSPTPAAGCPQDLSKCAPPRIGFAGFASSTMLVRLSCAGFAGQSACSGGLTFKAVIRVRVRHGRKTRLVRKTITVASASYSVAAGGSGSVKLRLTGAATAALKTAALTASSSNPSATIHLPKTKVKARARRRRADDLGVMRAPPASFAAAWATPTGVWVR